MRCKGHKGHDASAVPRPRRGIGAQQLLGRHPGVAQRFGDRFIGDMAVGHIQAVFQVRVV